jgi:hypothetical protein
VTSDALAAASAPRVRSADPWAFTFISRQAQIDVVHRYLQTLPEHLSR